MLLKNIRNAKIENIEDEITDITNLISKTTLNAKINEVKTKIPSITNLATTVAHNAKINQVKVKIPNITDLATTTALTSVANKMPNSSTAIQLKKLTITQKLVKLKRKFLIMIMNIILLLQSLIS